MYNLRQFRFALYILLLLGVTGFAVASDSPGLWLLTTGGILLNAWLVRSGRFVPMPRLLANGVTLIATAIVALEIYNGDNTPILTIGQFLALLHLVKLFEQRANRDYAQLLVLSMLLMVAAAISTASLIFGLTFMTYMFLSLYCCLLFHLKVEADNARRAYGITDRSADATTLLQDQRFLTRSMRRLTTLVAATSVAMAVAVFIFFPRSGAMMFSPVSLRATQAMTGFSDEVSFQKIAQIAENNTVIARVELAQNNQPVTHVSAPLYLRGSCLQVYSGRNIDRGGLWTWTREVRSLSEDEDLVQLNPDAPTILNGSIGEGVLEQKITLEPTGTRALFAAAGVTQIESSAFVNVRYTHQDGILQTVDALRRPVQYTVYSTGDLPQTDESDGGEEAWRLSSIDPQIAQFARRPDVCGVDPKGHPLADRPAAGDHSYDAQIALNISSYLRNNFKYTLDLTDASALGDRDPIVAFLTDFKKGHCEYFAGAMTLMCQSLGIPARLAVGFRCDPPEFNTLGNYYLVKQSDAHAWCEVFTGSRWESFDPTATVLAPDWRHVGPLAKLANLLDYLEFKWANSVVAYDRDQRQTLLESINSDISTAAVAGGQKMGQWPQKLDRWWENIRPSLFDAAIVLVLLFGLASIVAFFLERRKMRRRARRIGLDVLPVNQQLRLARQLAFYDDLLGVLDRHKIVRADHLTPLEFCRSLSFLPNAIYDDIYGLTNLFYRIRYGGAELNARRQRHLAAAVNRVEHAMASVTPNKSI
jgi:protein-glutamine gamma-glutamyltransferase